MTVCSLGMEVVRIGLESQQHCYTFQMEHVHADAPRVDGRINSFTKPHDEVVKVNSTDHFKFVSSLSWPVVLLEKLLLRSPIR